MVSVASPADPISTGRNAVAMTREFPRLSFHSLLNQLIIALLPFLFGFALGPNPDKVSEALKRMVNSSAEVAVTQMGTVA
jgi:hypothetical protein